MNNTLDIARIMYVLIYFSNFGPISSGSIESTNGALGLKHRHNNLESLGLLIGPLEDYPKLSIYINNLEKQSINFKIQILLL